MWHSNNTNTKLQMLTSKQMLVQLYFLGPRYNLKRDRVEKSSWISVIRRSQSPLFEDSKILLLLKPWLCKKSEDRLVGVDLFILPSSDCSDVSHQVYKEKNPFVDKRKYKHVIKGWQAIAKLKPLSLFIYLLLMLKKAFDNVRIEKWKVKVILAEQ